MSAITVFEQQLMSLIFTNSVIVDIGDIDGLPGSATAGSLWIALFTANPGETGDITNEATYGAYARIEVPRTAAYWSSSNGQVVNAQDILFPECTSGSQTLTHWAVCYDSSGPTILIYGALSSPLLMAAQVQPRIAAGNMIMSLD